MRCPKFVAVLLAAGTVNAQARNGGGNNNNNNNNNNNQNANGNANALTLNAANVQTNSQSSGLNGDAEANQAPSATDAANFINFCTGKTLTNGLQVRGGSCNGIVMGDLPATNKMVSAVFKNPTHNSQVAPNTPINFQVQIANLQAGAFTNPDNTYYSAPQSLNGGTIVGHTHISVQDMGGSFNPATPLDAQTFAFFKGINDAGNGNGLLSATLAQGLPEGFYRVCSITSASNHQPVIMPVAQRGPQDDCVRFQVTANAGGAANSNNNNQASTNNNQQAANNNTQAETGQGKTGGNNNNNNNNANAGTGRGKGGGGNGNRQGKGRGRNRFARGLFSARAFIA